MKPRIYLRQLAFSVLVLALLTTMKLPGCKALAEEPKAELKKLPPVHWTRSRKIDVKHLVINVQFDWAKKQAFGTTAVTFAPFDSTSTIPLDAAFFTINSITTQEGKVLKFEYDGGDQDDNLKITLDRVYQAGEETTVIINYRTNWVNLTDPNNLSGSTGKGVRFFEPTSTDRTRPREIWSMGEPEGNRYWFPGFDSPNDFRTTELIATVDKKLTVISNGTLIATRDNPDGTHTFHWKTDTPYANHLTSFVIGEYVDVQQNVDGIELHTFGYPNETEAVAATVVRLPEMVKFYSEVTGVKYPYPRYSQVSVQDMPWGVGNNMVAIQSENMIDDARTHADFFYLWDGLEAETLAYQWFGNFLTCRDWSHIWLNRGVAHYFDGLFNEHKNGREEYLLWQLLSDQNTYLSDWNAGYRHPIVTRNYADTAGFTSDNYAYSRAAAVLHMLRKQLGEEKWRKAINHYLKSNANQPVTTEDFRKAVEETCGQPLDWFFDQWLYKMGHPMFEITKTYDDAKQQLVLSVRQTQKIDPQDPYPQVEFFEGTVEIEIDGRIEPVWLEPKAENVFSFAASAPPKLVNFDYESTWIKEIKFEKSLDELLYQLQHDTDVLGKRWAMSELVTRATSPTTSAEAKMRIYTGLRATIQSTSYWRLRLVALVQLQNLLAPATSTAPARLDNETITMLLKVIHTETAWNRAAAITFLGLTQDPKHADIYLNALTDVSDRVISAAATALGRSKSPRAFEALARLVNKPSWKNQSLMSALTGLKQLGDPRGFEIAFKALADPNLLRWRLPTPPVWDYRIIAADTIAALGKSEAAFPLIFERFKKSVDENDLNGMFNNVLLLIKLADPRGQQAFELLKVKFKDNPDALTTVRSYEAQFTETLALKKP